MNWPRWKLGGGGGREGGRGRARALLRRRSLRCCFFFSPLSLSLSLFFFAAAEGPGRPRAGEGGGRGGGAGKGGGAAAEPRRGEGGFPLEGKGGRRDPAVSAFAPALAREKGGSALRRGRPGRPRGGCGRWVLALSPPPPPPPPPLRSRCSHLCTRRLGEGGGEGGAGGGVSGCAPLPPTIPCKCKKKKKRERERERYRALARPGGVGRSVCTESQLRRAQTHPGMQFSLIFIFYFLRSLFVSFTKAL